MRGTRRSMAAVLALLAFALIGVPAASAAQGDLDPTYGVGGRAELVPDADYGGVTAVAPDGSAYGAVSPYHTPGTLYDPSPGPIFTRVSADGVPDATFADHGALRQTQAFPGGWRRDGGDERRPIADAAGRLVSLAEISRSSGCCIEQFGAAISRVLPDGRPDPAFGTDGTVVLGPDQLEGSGLLPTGVATDEHGRLLITGDVLPTGGRQGALLRLTPEGLLDTTFGTAGVATLATPYGAEGAAVVSPDGKIGVNGLFETDFSGVAQFDDAGRVVEAFGDHGVAKLAPWAYEPSLTLRPGGGYLYSAAEAPADTKVGFFLVASTADGRPDRSFGTDGRLYPGLDLPPGAGVTFISSFSTQPSGRVLLISDTALPTDAPGTSTQQLERYLPGGTPDVAFGARGVLRPDGLKLGAGPLYDAAHARILVGEQPAEGSRKAHIVALQGNDPPLPAIEVADDDDLQAGTPVQLSGARSSDGPGGRISAYKWDLDGDGDADDATGATVSTTYATPGIRSIALVTTDDDGATATTRREIAVGVARTAPAPTPTSAVTPPAPTPATGPSPSAPSAPTLAAGRATLTGSRRLRVDRRHRVRVLLRCPAGTSGCIGVVALRLGKATFARSAFRLKAGTTTKLRLTVRSSAVRRATTAKARPVALVDGRSTRLRLVR